MIPRREPVRPGGIVKVRSRRNWSPSSRSSWRAKSEDAPAPEFDVPAARSGRERPDLAGALAAVRSRVDAEDLARVDFGKDRVPGEEFGFGVVDAAGGRRRHQAPVRGEQVDVEFVERDLGQVFEIGLHLTGHRIGAEGPDKLGVHPEPVGDEE